MFKFVGLSLIMLSVFISIYHISIKDRNTYIFLSQTAEILSLFFYDGMNGRTYPQILARKDLSNFKYYRTFDFIGQNEFFKNLEENKSLTVSEIVLVKEMFSRIGHRPEKQEKEYLCRCIKVLKQKSLFYNERFCKNNRTNLLGGLSAGLIIMIVLI